MCTDFGHFAVLFLCANAIIITFKNNMCSKRFLDKLAKLCVYLSFHFSCFLCVDARNKKCENQKGLSRRDKSEKRAKCFAGFILLFQKKT